MRKTQIFRFPCFVLLLLLMSTGAINSVDASSKTLKQVGQIETISFCYDVLVRDNIAYVSLPEIGLKIYDVNDPGEITEIGSVTEYTGGFPHQLFLDSDNILYMGDGEGGLAIFNVNDPYNPTRIINFL
ncbi:MAG: hypothetical protein ACXAD7_25045, partial [Candidatus Kariarchaeaceae archaeon]